MDLRIFCQNPARLGGPKMRPSQNDVVQTSSTHQVSLKWPRVVLITFRKQYKMKKNFEEKFFFQQLFASTAA